MAQRPVNSIRAENKISPYWLSVGMPSRNTMLFTVQSSGPSPISISVQSAQLLSDSTALLTVCSSVRHCVPPLKSGLYQCSVNVVCFGGKIPAPIHGALPGIHPSPPATLTQNNSIVAESWIASSSGGYNHCLVTVMATGSTSLWIRQRLFSPALTPSKLQGPAAALVLHGRISLAVITRGITVWRFFLPDVAIEIAVVE